MFCPYLNRSDPRCIAARLSSRNLDDFVFICGDDYESCEVYAKIKQELADRTGMPDENSAKIDYSKIEDLISESEEQAASAEEAQNNTSRKGHGRQDRNGSKCKKNRNGKHNNGN
ncbi:MAG: hypothetical protein U5N86_04105 [Planctomycetota bacterium]|nr:hypothetical protein [Planctomycetota bacterium]